MKRKEKIPRQYSLVKLDFEILKQKWFDGYREKWTELFGTPDKPITYIFFGDIPNQLGHCILLNHRTGKFECFFHTDYFIELTEDET